MVDLKTNPALLEALHRAAQRKPTADEIQRQRVSFIMSAVNSKGDVTASRIQEVLAEQEGIRS